MTCRGDLDAMGIEPIEERPTLHDIGWQGRTIAWALVWLVVLMCLVLAGLSAAALTLADPGALWRPDR
jgi:NhaP-type Na+/H+ or K+/H+ antiporter